MLEQIKELKSILKANSELARRILKNQEEHIRVANKEFDKKYGKKNEQKTKRVC